MNRIVTLAPLVIVTATLALTACGADDTPTRPAPITRTVTATPEPVEVTDVPESCTNAIAEARNIARYQVEFINSAATLPELIGDAYEAGYGGGNLDQVIRKLDASTAVFNRVTAKTKTAVTRFNAAAGACEFKAAE